MTAGALSRRLRGSCLCGAATYDVADAFGYALICHCSQCRRTTGAGSKPFAGIERHHFVLHDTAPLQRYGEEDTFDAHCAKCGSLLFSQVREGRYVHVTLGTLIDTPTIRPTAHIFVASKAEWDVISDDLPQFAMFPTASSGAE